MSLKPKSLSAASKPAKKPRAKPIQAGKGKLAAKRVVKVPAKSVLTSTLPGGYRVFDTPVEPRHTTRERIAEAVAAFK